MYNVVAYINYICLPASCALAETKFRGERVLLAGWGLTSPSKRTFAEFRLKECQTSGPKFVVPNIHINLVFSYVSGYFVSYLDMVTAVDLGRQTESDVNVLFKLRC